MSKTEVFQVRLSAAEMSALANQARMLGMTKTALARTLLVAGQPQKPHSAPATPCPEIAELRQRIDEQERAFLQVVETIRSAQRRPYFGEWRLRRGVELGPAPGATQFDKLLWLARDYQSIWGVWPQPGDPGFGALPQGVDAAAWPKQPPPSAA